MLTTICYQSRIKNQLPNSNIQLYIYIILLIKMPFNGDMYIISCTTLYEYVKIFNTNTINYFVMQIKY